MNRKNCTPELLAPAGERAAAYAALAYGADAVYTGLSRFSARAEAVNLSARDLEEITAHAHGLPRPRRVYVTLNTLLNNAELPELVRSLALCKDCGVDAVIVQDLGVAHLARTWFPSLRLHASTQMALHNIEGVRAAARLGFKRVTLARELTINEIRSIVKQSPIPVEHFLHGALCYSYSGLCLYSSLLRGRSGNRGACAYPCRKAFWTERPPKGAAANRNLVFSMKDLAGGCALPELVNTGVASLKIEGRKKSPLYVAAAVNYYRKLLDGAFAPGEQEACARDLQSIFSRPWTPLYLQNAANRQVIDPETTGHRGAPIGRIRQAGRGWIQFRNLLPLEVHDGLQFELPGESRPFGFPVEEIRLRNGRRVFEVPVGQDVEVPLPAQAPRSIPEGTSLFLSSSQAVKQRYRFSMPNPRKLRRRTPIRIRLLFSEDQVTAEAELSLHDETLKSTAGLEGPFETARNAETFQSGIQKVFSKLGETPFVLDALDIQGDARFVPISRLNQLRRDLTDELESLWTRQAAERVESLAEKAVQEQELQVESFTGQEQILKTDQPTALLRAYPDGLPSSLTEIIIELGRESIEQIEALCRALPSTTAVRLALPMITRSRDRENLLAQIRHFSDAGMRRWEAANLSALEFLSGMEGLDLSADWSLYSVNSAAIECLEQQGIRRFTISPEASPDAASALARRHPGRMVWPIHQDPPLFISESCPHAARLGHCPGPATCDFTEQVLTSASGERVRIVNRGCRFITLMEHPRIVPAPAGLPVLPRLDFLHREWHPGLMKQAIQRLFPNAG